MIGLTRLNGTRFFLNPELVEQIESTPDTVITLTTGNNIVVKESLPTVIEKIHEYRQKVMQQHQAQMAQLLTLSKGAE